MTALIDTPLTRHLGIDTPLICGPMYPCSNPELVAAVSEAGGIGVVQPVSLTYVHGHDFREGLRHIRSLTSRPIGMNALIESSSRKYRQRMESWIDIALEEGVRFFVTSLGNPRWVVERAREAGGIVYHDVTELRWAEKSLAAGVDGLICVNNRAGGHAGGRTAGDLFAELAGLGVPLVCAGGIGTEHDFADAIRAGYAGVQMGTRFIVTEECTAPADYKAAIIAATADDIVLTERLTGVPVSVIRTPHVERTGLHAGPVARRLLRHPRTKHLMRTIYTLRSVWSQKRAAQGRADSRAYLQAGKSAGGVSSILPAGDIVRRCAAAASSPD
ncbi:MAG: nitronate monooxygenase [Gemmatimonadota bacterium]|jgi:nitronate monooxygenase|nr:2-nitropropane dioxygenase [Gemmatimonadota bacterium]MDP6460320.1 nitronate monooxygenase [Gemmatimonadota bacterium]MDP6528966.1 nitronate monooxygenase [Gemmatimonadota bacterium]MDP6802036.1 nitronate monooxygenase [Gemmatimonadota bacterium]MDP7031384.1 nitronate monooxygenase [Gemmatimonadota bacterium]